MTAHFSMSMCNRGNHKVHPVYLVNHNGKLQYTNIGSKFYIKYDAITCER